jgi:CRP-like cAMP-binding protein
VKAASGPPRHNRLLSSLSEAEWERFRPKLRLVWLPQGKPVHEADVKLAHVYFPVTSVIAIMGVMSDGHSAEYALVGNEGMAGVALLLGSSTSPATAIVQCAGWAYQIRTSEIQEEFARNGEFLHLLLLYTQALITQITQTAVCNRHHSIDQQLCRWLLLTLDRIDTSEFSCTQESIAEMLGVRREGITEAAGNLQKAGLIKYFRGHITVVDRAGLERRSCECYRVVRKESDRLLGQPRETRGAVSYSSIPQDFGLVASF